MRIKLNSPLSGLDWREEMQPEEVPADPRGPVMKAYLKRVHSAGPHYLPCKRRRIPNSSNGRAVSSVPARSRERSVIPNKACSTLQHVAAGDRRSIRQEPWFPSPPSKAAEVF